MKKRLDRRFHEAEGGGGSPAGSPAPSGAPAQGASAASGAGTPATAPAGGTGTPASSAMPASPPVADASKGAGGGTLKQQEDPAAAIQARVTALEGELAAAKQQGRIHETAAKAGVKDLEVYGLLAAQAEKAAKDAGAAFDLAAWTESQRASRGFLFGAAAPIVAANTTQPPPPPGGQTAETAALETAYAQARQANNAGEILRLGREIQSRLKKP